MRFNALIPELYCSDIARTLDFYTRIAGFAVRYARPEERFAFLESGDAQLMVEQPTDPARTWRAGPLEPRSGAASTCRSPSAVSQRCTRGGSWVGRASS